MMRTKVIRYFPTRCVSILSFCVITLVLNIFWIIYCIILHIMFTASRINYVITRLQGLCFSRINKSFQKLDCSFVFIGFLCYIRRRLHLRKCYSCRTVMKVVKWYHFITIDHIKQHKIVRAEVLHCSSFEPFNFVFCANFISILFAALLPYCRSLNAAYCVEL